LSTASPGDRVKTPSSWRTAAGSTRTVGSGFRVLAFDFRQSEEGRRFDVLAPIAYMRNSGAKTVSVIGASMGGDHAAEAAEAQPDAIDRIVLLAAGAYTPLIRAKARSCSS
jgi:pimeloyl-ACP methyl ester carboxylesterase